MASGLGGAVQPWARVPLSWPQWTVLVIYGLYLLPYVVVSYYERYAVPLDALKALLVLWAAERLLTRPVYAYMGLRSRSRSQPRTMR